MFVLERELAEVHLLLDNVSANPSTTVAERPVVTGGAEDLPPDWIEKICEITWPPENRDEERAAEEAALLIKAKDQLNRLSYPASGFTIAFTTLVTQTDLRRRDDRPDESAPPGKANENGGRGGGEGGTTSPTRRSLAETAYPDLVGKARSFGRWMRYVSAGLLLILVATCFLSWYVAWGNAQLAELKSLNEAITELDTTIANAEAEREKNPPGGAPANGPAPTASGAATPAPPTPPRTAPATVPLAPPELFVGYCGRPYKAVAQAVACETRTDRLSQRERVKWRLERWTCWFCGPDPSRFDEPLAAERSPDLASPDPARRAAAEQEAKAAAARRQLEKSRAERNKESLKEDAPARASTLANILGSAVLPFLYGLLGAAAAVIRSLSTKIRTSLLSPRDLTLSLQQLALGAVTGACIGLFIATPGEPAQGETLLGPVGLSGPAISFVAGFGVDAVFHALEELIKRIFNTTPAPAGTLPPQLPRTIVVRDATPAKGDDSKGGSDGSAGGDRNGGKGGDGGTGGDTKGAAGDGGGAGGTDPKATTGEGGGAGGTDPKATTGEGGGAGGTDPKSPAGGGTEGAGPGGGAPAKTEAGDGGDGGDGDDEGDDGGEDADDDSGENSGKADAGGGAATVKTGEPGKDAGTNGTGAGDPPREG